MVISHDSGLPAVRIELCGVLPDLEEYLLGGVLAEFRIDQDPAGHAEHTAGRQLVELGKRSLVAAGNAAQQRGKRVG